MLRVALLTTDSGASGAAVRRLLASGQLDIAVVADSSPFRSPRGPPTRRTLRALRRSWLLIAPYLLVNFVLPRVAGRSLSAFCRERGIPFLRLGDVNARTTVAALKGHGAEALLLYHFDQILTAGTIATFPSGIANVHPSLLPEHRGPVPTIHLMLQEHPRAGVTIHRVTPTIDDGAILAQAEVPLPAGISAAGAARHLHLAALPLVPGAIELLRTGAAGIPQTQRLPYCGFPTALMVFRLRRTGRRTVRWRDIFQGISSDL
ncbi:MAG TPA: formyltransferase family protein [Acetobacteraceae bacterium]|jgi:methionyl-tRNA formyltransferase|nr:formyltransferase family protein [Acetobacteraceae bacterium]